MTVYAFTLESELDPPPRHEFPVNNVTFHPDGTLVSSDEFGLIRFFDLVKEVEFEPLDGVLDPKWGTRVSISPDGTQIATSGCSRSGTESDCISGIATFYDYVTGELLSSLNGHDYAIYRTAFHPDGTLIATSALNDVWLWNPESGAQIGSITFGTFPTHIAFSPDGTLIGISGCSREVITDNTRTCNEGVVEIWEVEEGTKQLTLAHPDEVLSFDFSPDSAYITTGTAAGIVRLWNLESATADEITQHDGAVRAVAMHPVAALIASGGDDGLVRHTEIGEYLE